MRVGGRRIRGGFNHMFLAEIIRLGVKEEVCHVNWIG